MLDREWQKKVGPLYSRLEQQFLEKDRRLLASRKKGRELKNQHLEEKLRKADMKIKV